MILIDANLLLYAYNSSSKQHEAAREWLEQVLSRTEPVRLAWITILAFVRISTNFRAFENPLSVDEASSFVSEWLAQPTVSILDPGERLWDILSSLLTVGQVTGALVMDAHLAALAIEHGMVLCTTDKDFDRFPNLRMLNPLESSK